MDLYCERCGPEFWAEPLNAITNASYLIAAFAAWQSARKRDAISREVGLLIVLAATIGVGSFLFHTFATVWAMYLDIIPIFAFQLYFIWVYSREQIGTSPWISGLLLAGLLGASTLLLPLRSYLNGSMTYAPAWLLLSGFAAFHIRQAKHRPWQLMIAAILLFVALFFRTIDLMVCEAFPIGTHFLWHLITGAVIYLSMQSLIQNPTRGSASSAVLDA